MTSNTEPEGKAFAISEANSDYAAYKAFDNDGTTKWFGNGAQPLINSYIGYNFIKKVCVRKLFVNHAVSNWTTCKLQGANDSSNWEDIQDVTLSTQFNYSIIYNNKYYSLYRIVITDNLRGGNDDYADVIQLQFYGRSQN